MAAELMERLLAHFKRFSIVDRWALAQHSQMQSSFQSSLAMGIALVSVAGVLWGTSGTAQYLGAAAVSPFGIGAAQLLVASFFLLGVLLLSAPAGGHRLSLRSSGLRWYWFALASLGIGGYSVFFYEGIKHAGVGVGTAVAIGSSPIWAGLLQLLVLQKSLPLLWWGGMLVSVIGGVAMVMRTDSSTAVSGFGIVMCLLAGLSYGGYALINKRLVSHMSPKVVNFYVFTGAALFAIPVAWLKSGLPQWSLSAVLVVIYLGVVVSGIAHMLFSMGLCHISGPTGVALSLIEPLAAFFLAILIVGEHQPISAWVGVVCVLLGLMVIVRSETQRGSS